MGDRTDGQLSLGEIVLIIFFGAFCFLALVLMANAIVSDNLPFVQPPWATATR